MLFVPLQVAENRAVQAVLDLTAAVVASPGQRSVRGDLRARAWGGPCHSWPGPWLRSASDGLA